MDLHYPHLNILSVTAEAGSCNVFILCPFQFQVIAVADPRKFACNKLQRQHKIIDENVFEGLYHSKQQISLIFPPNYSVLFKL